MLMSARHVLSNYHTLVNKMHKRTPIKYVEVMNPTMMCDLDLLLGLACLLHMMHGLGYMVTIS
jgi:hypothetical protein